MIKELVVASNNQNKIKEIKELLADLNIIVYSLKDLNIDIDVEETGSTFEDNALLKAQAIYDLINKPVLSDDSGLEVLALDNEPGIYSARYAGPKKDDNDNIDKVLSLLENETNRQAQFVCAMCLVSNQGSKCIRGISKGSILKQREGSNGFGYDPIFYSDALNKSFGLATPEEKNKVSHRHDALMQIVEYLKENHNAN